MNDTAHLELAALAAGKLGRTAEGDVTNGGVAGEQLH